MSFLQDKCRFGFYTRDKADGSRPFRCGDDDLDEFFQKDAFLQSEELLCKNYCFTPYNKERNLAFYERNGFSYLFSTEEQEREFRGVKPDRPLNSRLMYFDLIELVR